MVLLELENVSKTYARSMSGFAGRSDGHQIKALEGISFTMAKGGSLGIMGESGAGKSTLAELITGLRHPSSGSITVNGRLVEPGDRKQRRLLARQVQLIWQDAAGSLDPRMKVEKTIAEALTVHEMAPREDQTRIVHGLLAEVGLDAEIAVRLPHQLSGGQAQRVAIARALAVNPELLVCDEPASSLDARVKARVASLLAGLRRERNLSLLVIAHDLKLVRALTDDVIVMRKGEIVETGTTEEVLNHPRQPYTRLLIDSEPQLRRPAWPANNGGAVFKDRRT